MRTIVHAGFHKTGTTALQAVLSASGEWLAGKGVVYPTAGRGTRDGHHLLACSFAARRTRGGPNDLFLPERERFCSEAGDCSQVVLPLQLEQGGEIRVISSEIISTFDCHELAEMFNGLGPIEKIVLYYRGGIDFLYSCWSTKVRWGSMTGFREFLSDTMALKDATPISGVLRHVTAQVGVAGEASLALRNYSAACANANGIAGDFFESVLGLAPGGGLASMQYRNQSPPYALMEVLRALASLTSSNTTQPTLVYPRLRVATSEDEVARELCNALCAAVPPLMRNVTLREIDPACRVLDREGHLRILDTTQSRLLPSWDFPPDAALPCVATEDSLEILAAMPEAVELSALLSSTPESTRRDVAS